MPHAWLSWLHRNQKCIGWQIMLHFHKGKQKEDRNLKSIPGIEPGTCESHLCETSYRLISVHKS